MLSKHIRPSKPLDSGMHAGYALENRGQQVPQLPPACHLHFPFPVRGHATQGSSGQVNQAQINDGSASSPGEGSRNREVACIVLCSPFHGSRVSDVTL